MKILLTGANGFTGRHFVRTAQQHEHEVISIASDLTDAATLKQQISQLDPDFVVHLAAISFVGHANANEFYSVNVIGTLNLLDALITLKNPPKRVLLASSANVYGNCEYSPITEGQTPNPINHYAMSKLAMEYLAKNYLDRLPLFFVRPFNYTGPGQAQSFVIPKLITHFAQCAQTIELGNIEVEREFNDVRFICDAYLRLLHLSKPGAIYNICSNQPVSLKSVIQLLTELTGHHIGININPNFVRSNEIHRLCGDPEKLRRTIGTIESPKLLDTLQWMLSNHVNCS